MPDNIRLNVKSEGTGDVVQAGGDIHVEQHVNYHNGLSYESVVEIFNDKAKALLESHWHEAEDRMAERIQALRDQVIPALIEAEVTDVLKDPDYQFTLFEAQQSAARYGDSEEVITLLSSLLLQRTAADSKRLKIASRRAVDAVGQISSDALSALAILTYMVKLVPVTPYLQDHLAMYERAFSSVLRDELPSGEHWIEELDLVGCLNVHGSGVVHLKTFTELFLEGHKGFICGGIEREVADLLRAEFVAFRPQLAGLVVTHPLDSSRDALIGYNEARFRDLASENAPDLALDERFIGLLDRAVAANQYDGEVADGRDLLHTVITGYPTITKVEAWWQRFPSLSITTPGVLVAYATLKDAGTDMPPVTNLV